MSKYRWFNFGSIVFFLMLIALITRPVPANGAQAMAAALTPTPIDFELTPTPEPLDTLTPEPTVIGEPNETPTPAPEPIPQFQWDVDATEWQMPAGGQMVIPLRINLTDAGVAQLAFSVSVSSQDLQVTIDPATSGPVKAGDGIDLFLTAHAITDSPLGEIQVIVTAADDQGNSTQTALTVSVAWAQPITVEFDHKQQPVDPGGSVTSRVEITNRDSVPHHIQTRAYINQEMPFDYSMPDVPDSLTLEPGETRRFKFEMRPRLGAEAGNEGKVVFEARLLDVENAKGKDVVVGDQAQATVTEVHAVTVSVVPDKQEPAWGESATYAVVVTNTGSLPGAVRLDVTNGPNHYTATLKLPKEEINLKPGQTAVVNLEVEPVFAGLKAFLADLSPRLHQMTTEDKAQFTEFLRDRDDVTVTAMIQQEADSATATTLRPERPKIDLPITTEAPQAASPVGRGPHATNSITCGACHTPHGSPMPDQLQQDSSLLLASTVRGLCDTCHDGTGSVYNVEAGLIGGRQPSNAGPIKLGPDALSTGYHYGTASFSANHSTIDFVPKNPKQLDIVVSGSGAVSAHPIEQQGSPAGGDNLTGQLLCTSCHDPHGQTSAPRLLAINFAGLKGSLPFIATYNQSPAENVHLVKGSLEVCSTCHASLDNHGSTEPQKLTDDPALGRPWPIYQQRGQGWLPLESEGESANQHMVCLTCHAAHGSRASLPGSFEKLMREPFVEIQEKYGTWCMACHDL